MIINVVEEAGYESALKGLALSYYDHETPFDEWWTQERRNKSIKRMKLLAFKGGGHNKALASMQVWLYVQAPRCWWSEFDTYKVGVTANSSSTMHTLDKRFTREDDYDDYTHWQAVRTFNRCLENYKDVNHHCYKDITRLKMNLPEGWLQERQICTNYMALQNICKQREGHRLNHWGTFINEVKSQVAHRELIDENYIIPANSEDTGSTILAVA